MTFQWVITTIFSSIGIGMECGSCKNISYCGAYCQRSDWPRHSIDCKKTQYAVNAK